MALLDPDDRRDHDLHIRFSAREYLLVLAALKLSGKSSVSAGVREFALERAQQINPAGVDTPATKRTGRQRKAR